MSVYQVGKGKTVRGTVVKKGASQIVFRGGAAVDVAVSSGGLQILSGGRAVGTRLRYGGTQWLYGGAQASGTLLQGRLNAIAPWDGAESVNAYQCISGGVAYDTVLRGANARQSVYAGGRAEGTVISSGGWQRLHRKGVAKNTVVRSGGYQQVRSGALASASDVLRDGWLEVRGGGRAVSVSVAGGGRLTAGSDARLDGIALKSGARALLEGGAILQGKNSFAGAAVSGGSASKRVRLAKGAALSIGARTDMSKLHLEVASASLATAGTGSTLGSLTLKAGARVAYDVRKVAAKETVPLLKVSARSSLARLGAFSVTVAASQGAGVYELSTNLVQTRGVAYTVFAGTRKLGTASLNGLGRISGSAVYKVESRGTATSLTVAALSAPRKGTAKAETLTGSASWDVFYGGKGNDILKGVSGRDVAVYDKTAWGRDTIASTKGTMTLLFKDLKAADIVQKLKGTTMTFTRKTDRSQTITVQGWKSATHNVVFGGAMSAFDKWLKASKPGTAMATAARNDALKKAGLAQA